MLIQFIYFYSFFFLTVGHVGPQFLNQGLNSYWKHGVFFFFF